MRILRTLVQRFSDIKKQQSYVRKLFSKNKAAVQFVIGHQKLVRTIVQITTYRLFSALVKGSIF